MNADEFLEQHGKKRTTDEIADEALRAQLRRAIADQRKLTTKRELLEKKISRAQETIDGLEAKLGQGD